jgi:polyisoprenoid-binding protein YceI
MHLLVEETMFGRTLIGAAVAAITTAAPLGAQTVAAAQPAPQQSGAAAWQIDQNHSELSFRIRHLVSRVRGTFDEWSGSLVADPNDLAGGSVEVDIATRSINTRHERRDNHLRSGDFFLADEHPQITFRSSRVETAGEQLRVHGDLTMRGVTRPVVLEGRFLGITRDGQGRNRMGFEAETTVNRHDFGVSWNNVAEGGGLVLGEEVTISIVIAAVQQ